MMTYLYIVGRRRAARRRGRACATWCWPSPTTQVPSLMEDDLVEVTADVDEEEVGRIMTKYDLLAIPVVDEERRLLGIVTLDDALEAVLPDDWKQRLPRAVPLGRRGGPAGRAAGQTGWAPAGASTRSHATLRRGAAISVARSRRKRATSPFSCTRRKPAALEHLRVEEVELAQVAAERVVAAAVAQPERLQARHVAVLERRLELLQQEVEAVQEVLVVEVGAGEHVGVGERGAGRQDRLAA